MALGRYKVPSELKNENKWFKFFTIPQLCVIGVALVVAIFLLIIFAKQGVFPVGFFIFLLIMIAAFSVVMIKVPDEYYLFGAKEPVGVIFLRLLIKKLRHRKVYVANYSATRRDTDENI